MRTLAFAACFLMTISPVWAKDFKVATVDLAKLFSAYPGTKAAQDKFNALATKKQQELAGPQQDLEQMDADLRKQSSVLTAKQKADKQYMIKKKTEDLIQQKNQIMAELKDKEDEMTDEVLGQIKAIVVKVAKAKGYDAVFDSEKTILVTDPVDLTNDVIKAFPATADVGDGGSN